jgi:N-acetylneuraminic acid mutarotase
MQHSKSRSRAWLHRGAQGKLSLGILAPLALILAAACVPATAATGPAEMPSLPRAAVHADGPDQFLGAWRTGAPLPVEIAEVAAASIEAFIYTGGGFTPPGGTIGRWFGRFDTENDRWERRADLPVAVHHPGLAAAGGKLWLSGGYTGQLNVNQATNRLDMYDPVTDTWARKADMPGRRAAHFLVALDAKLYAVGGVSDANASMWIYDLASSAWETRPGAPTLREHLGAAASGGKLYVVAGRWGGQRLGVLEAYDPATGAWSTRAPMPGICGGCSAAATADGRIHVTGGEAGGGQTFNDHFVYDPETDTWIVAASMPTARHGIGAAAVGERFYVIAGGRTAGLAYSDLVEWWAPEGGEPTPTLAPTATATAIPGQPTPTPTRLDDGPCVPHRSDSGCLLFLPQTLRAASGQPAGTLVPNR